MKKLFTFLFALVASTGMMYAETYSGTCGAESDGSNLQWSFDTETGLLVISGSGAMADMDTLTLPWYAYHESVRAIRIDEGVISIGKYAFHGNLNLTSVSIPSTVNEIKSAAFDACCLLVVSIPNSVEFIAEDAFRDVPNIYYQGEASGLPWGAWSVNGFVDGPCVYTDETKTSLVTCLISATGELNIPNSVTKIYDEAFYNCNKLTAVTLPENITVIGEKTFYLCSGLTSVIIPKQVTEIGVSAFNQCSNLKSISLSGSVSTIDDYAFALCSKLESIICHAVLPPAMGEGVFGGVDCGNIILYVPEESIEAYRAAEVWKEFENIEAIEPLTETVTVAQALEIGQGLEVKETFETDLAIVGYVVGVETEFDSQKRNQTYWIADTQSGKATGALYVYRGACDQEVKRGYKVSIQGKITRYTDLVIETVEKAQVTILDETETDEATILMGKCGAEGDSTNLSWQLNLSTWTLDIQGSGPMADSLKYLPWHSQNYRNSITSVNLPDGLTTIGLGAFEYCKKLTSITIPETVNLIGKWAFYNCTNLTSVNIPESVHAFGLYAFVGIAVPKPLMNSRLFCFMPREYSGKYTIPEGITNIISYAFERCVKLSEVIIPSSAKDLGYSAFGSCTALQSITSLAANPPACREEMSFKDVDKSIPLYVPAESLDAYKAADEWKDFTNIQPIQAEEVLVTEIEAEPTYNSVVIEWPKVDEAMVYTIEIRKDGELICTLTFNEQGQLQGITFAKPSRNGGRNSQVRMAIQTATGWQYTISGLDPDTEYTYSVVAKKNASDTETLYSESISFTTKQTPTGIDEILDSSNPAIMKFIRDGQLYILRGEKVYTVTGQEVR